MKKILKTLVRLFAELSFPVTFLSALWVKFVKRYAGTGKISNGIFMSLGVLPILDHYYEPLINPKKHLTKSLREDRNLPGVNLNDDEQLELLSKFKYQDELLAIPMDNEQDTVFSYHNPSYAAGDAEYLYNMIRHYKPSKLTEIGSGHSTLMAQKAIAKNREEDPNYQCIHTCIEPYEMPWLKELDIQLIRKKVEDMPMSTFQELGRNDILFIDSSHIIRPQGDVLFEYLEILPALQSGVLIHVHDIFTPKDYLDEWIYEKHLTWNEQYLLEAFLSFNSEFRIIGALNYLAHQHRDAFSHAHPVFKKEPQSEPGAFWMQKN